MGVQTPVQQTLRGAVKDAGGARKAMACGDTEAEKDRDTAGGEETTTATETGGLEDTAAQEGA